MKSILVLLVLRLSGCASSLLLEYSRSVKQAERTPLHAPIEMVRLDKPRMVQAQQICNDSNVSWKISEVSPALYLTLPEAGSRIPGILTTKPPKCKSLSKQLLEGLPPLELVIATQGMAFSPEDRGEIPSRALLQLETGVVVAQDSNVRYLEKHHTLLYSRNGVPAVAQIDLNLQAYSDSLALRHSGQVNFLLLATIPLDIASAVFLSQYIDGATVAKAVGIYLGVCGLVIVVATNCCATGH